MFRTLLTLSSFLLLSGCSQYIEAQPYMTGTFVGYYLTDAQATPVGLRLETRVVEKSKTRYIFSGTATVGTQSYHVEGSEEILSNLGYLSLTPQATRPPSGFLEMSFIGADGAFAYGLCATVYYNSDRIDTPYTFDGTTLFAKRAADTPLCNFEEPIAEVTLEKLRR